MVCFIADEELDRVVLPAGHHLGCGLSHPGWNSGNPHAPKIINPKEVLKKILSVKRTLHENFISCKVWTTGRRDPNRVLDQ
jgi:hypothetical protein